MADVVLLTISETLAYASASGAFGGFVQVCTKIKTREKAIIFEGKITSLRNFFIISLTSIVSGIGSAIGLIAFLYFSKIYKGGNDTESVMLLVSACLIAGIAADRLIPRYTQSLETKLHKIEEETKATASKIENIREIEKKNSEAQKASDLLTEVQEILRPSANRNQKLKAISNVQEQLVKTPLNRKLAIFLGRLLRQVDDCEGAIAELNKFLDKKREVGEIADDDFAAALYNIACYHSLLWTQNNEEERRMLALSHLEQSVKIIRDNASEAREDLDFKGLQGDPEFVRITTM